MLMLLAALAAQGAGIVSNSKPPQAVVVSLEQPSTIGISASPRIVATAAAAQIDAQPANVAVPIGVRVSVGNRILFSDTLRVAPGSGANYSENRSEAAPTSCPALRPYEAVERSSLSIQLYLRDNPAGNAVNVSVSWQRPAPGSCSSDATRSVQLGQTVQLAPGQTATIEGDAGLLVTLTRR